jgi:hypothetical protein
MDKGRDTGDEETIGKDRKLTTKRGRIVESKR